MAKGKGAPQRKKSNVRQQSSLTAESVATTTPVPNATGSTANIEGKDNNSSNQTLKPAATVEGDGEMLDSTVGKQSEDENQENQTAASLLDKNTPRKMSRGKGRFIFKNLWDICCNEVESEIKEVDNILKKLGLPPVNYTISKSYELTDYDSPPDLATCKSKDFLDFYVFPYLLPAISSLVQFARDNRIFQCRYCTFNATDFLVEYLYNNNPRYPERALNPTSLYEIPFCKEWLSIHPRTPPPNWMLMTSEEAAIVIQRAIRGYMVRVRPEVQEMRQFWREIRKEQEEEKAILHKLKEDIRYSRYSRESGKFGSGLSPYYAMDHYSEMYGENDDTDLTPDEPLLSPMRVSHHSDNCIYCQAFRTFLASQPPEKLKSYERKVPSVPDAPGDAADETADKRSSMGKESGNNNNNNQPNQPPPISSTDHEKSESLGDGGGKPKQKSGNTETIMSSLQPDKPDHPKQNSISGSNGGPLTELKTKRRKSGQKESTKESRLAKEPKEPKEPMEPKEAKQTKELKESIKGERTI